MQYIKATCNIHLPKIGEGGASRNMFISFSKTQIYLT